MIFKWKKGITHIEMEQKERVFITSKNDKCHYLDVTIDEFDDVNYSKKVRINDK